MPHPPLLMHRWVLLLVVTLGAGFAPGALPAPAPISVPASSAGFDGEAMAAHVRWLADPARDGRGLGTAGLEAAARYVAEAFRAAGLPPARSSRSRHAT